MGLLQSGVDAFELRNSFAEDHADSIVTDKLRNEMLRKSDDESFRIVLFFVNALNVEADVGQGGGSTNDLGAEWKGDMEHIFIGTVKRKGGGEKVVRNREAGHFKQGMKGEAETDVGQEQVGFIKGDARQLTLCMGPFALKGG